MKQKYILILLLLALLILPFAIFIALQQLDNRSNAQVASFSFTAGGDHGMDGSYDATLNVMRSAGANFHFALGDLSHTPGGEQAWCTKTKAVQNNVVVLSGEYESGQVVGGNINNYAQACPFTLGSMTGEYGKQFYFDYPQNNPIARFIGISPGLNLYNYEYGGNGYTFTQQAIDSAKASGIKWIIVGMHKNCITVGEKTCEIGDGILKLLIDKRVDLILQGHDHIYARTHMLTCFQLNTFDVSCVSNNGTSGQYNYGEGSVIVIAGTTGKGLSPINASDGESKYFAKAQGDTYGIPKYTVTQNGITATFLRSGGGGSSDSFAIGEGLAGEPTMVPPNTGATQTPTLITPTVYCVGGSGGEPCATIPTAGPVQPTTAGGGTNPTAIPPIGGVSPTNGTSNPVPTVNPCVVESANNVAHNKKQRRSSDGGFIEQFFKFLFWLIEYILRGGSVPAPTDPVTPTPCPEPTNIVVPTIATDVTPTIFGQPTINP